MTDLLHSVAEVDRDFQAQRPQLCQQVSFREYLPRFVALHSTTEPALHFPLLAKLAQSDLELALQAGETALASDYLAAFPELAASPAVINDLLRTEARLRCGGDALRLWQFVQRLPEAYRTLFVADGVVPRYQLLRRIGGGGQADVWLASDSELKREVAVKVPLRQDEQSLQSFVREAQLTARFQHPAIVPIYGLARTTEGNLCYAMQRLELTQLKESIDRYHGIVLIEPAANGVHEVDTQQLDAQAPTVISGQATAVPQPTPSTAAKSTTEPADSAARKRRDLLRMIGQLIVAARAVAYAHQQQILHLDLKPENILVGEFGETMVLDWGLAKSQEEALAGAGGATLRYMSPEVARRWFDERADPPTPLTDVYGLGATLYHMLTGRPPFAFGTDEFSRSLAAGSDFKERCIHRVAHESPQAVNKISPAADRVLAAICHKAISSQPTDRYPSAAAFAVELEKWQNNEETLAHPFSPAERTARWLSKNQRHLASVSLAVVVLLIAAWFGWRWLQQRDVAQLIDNLPQVSADGLTPLIDRLAEQPSNSRVLLQQRLNSLPPGEVDSAWRYRLALLRCDQGEVFPLLMDLMTLEHPDEFAVLSRELRRKGPAEIPAENLRLPSMADDDPGRRLRAAAVLAGFDPQHEWSAEEGEIVAAEMVRANPQWLAVYDKLLRGSADCQEQTVRGLNRIAADSTRSQAEAINAAAILANWQASDPPSLVALVALCTPEQLSVVANVVQVFKQHVGAELVTQQATAVDRFQKSPSTEHAASAANLTLALWRADPSTFDGQWLQPAADPRLRTELIHRFPAARFSATQMVKLVRDHADVKTRSALLLALAGFRSQELSAELRERFLVEIRASPQMADPEFIAAVEYLHSRWNSPMQVSQAALPKPEEFGWQLTTGHAQASNHRMVAVPLTITAGPTLLGAPAGEGHQDEVETARPVNIPRSFAIAAKEVSRAQFREFLQDKSHTAVDDREPEQRVKELIEEKTRRFGLQDDFPVFEINLAEAAAYCNWLSARENLELCYPENIIELALLDLPERFPKLSDEFLARNGYRLPTEEEWELACRAGATTPRYFGDQDEYLSEYAVFRRNSRLGPLAIAQRRPNAWGLFDMHGNVAEWCHTTQAARERSGDVVTDEGPLATSQSLGVDEVYFLRGCAHFNAADVLRSAYRPPPIAWNVRHVDGGFRIVRTLAAE